jgi:hypothetical protein
MFRLLALGLCFFSTFSLAGSGGAGGTGGAGTGGAGAGGAGAGAASEMTGQEDSSSRTRSRFQHLQMTAHATTIEANKALEFVEDTTRTIASFSSSAANIVVPFEPAGADGAPSIADECKFKFGNEVPGLEGAFKECSDNGRTGTYCKCIEDKLSLFVGEKKLKEDQDRYGKALAEKSAEFLINQWTKEYSKMLKEFDDVNNFTGGGDRFVGGFCSSEIMARDALTADKIQPDCDPEQFKTFRKSLLRVAKVGLVQGSESGVAEYLEESLKPSMEAINGGQIYSCLEESELNLLTFFNTPPSGGLGFVGIATEFNNRAIRVLMLEEGLKKFTDKLASGEEVFVKDPSSLDPTMNRRDDPALSQLFEMLPFAKVLLKEFTSTASFDRQKKQFIAHTNEEKKANFQKLKSLIQDLSKFSKELKEASGSQFDSTKKAYEILANFNLNMRGKITDIKKSKKDGLENSTNSRCTELSARLIAIACNKPILANPRYVEKLMGSTASHDLPSHNQCLSARANGGELLYSCLVTQSGGCKYNPDGRRVFAGGVGQDMVMSAALDRDIDAITVAKNGVAAHYCRDYSEWVRNESPCSSVKDRPGLLRECMLNGGGTREKFVEAKPYSALAGLIKDKTEVDNQTGGAASASNGSGAGVANSMGKTRFRDEMRDLASALADGLADGSGGLSAQSYEGDGSFMQVISEITEGAAAEIAKQTGGTQASNQMNLAPFINPEAFKREVAQKDEEIKEKEQEIAQRVAEKQSAPVAEQSGLSAQIAALQADLKRLHDERNDLERHQQKIAATDAEVAGSGNSPAANYSAGKRTRVPASVTTGDDDDDDETARSSAFNTGTTGGTVGAAASSTAAASAGFNTAGSFGGSLGAARAGTVQGLNAALLAANEAKALVISGQSIPTTNVVSLEVANVKDTASLEQLISAQRDRLQFNSEGWATVEVIDQATKSTIYMQVRLDNSKLVVTQLPNADQQGIRKQVREWTASYTNFLKNIKKVKRDTAGVTE